MTWGKTTDEDEAHEVFAEFLAAGGTLVDTADMYNDGASEEILGRVIAAGGHRDRVVLATKAVQRPGSARFFDASRGHLLRALDASLRRLGTDVIDLWQLHSWDWSTPLDETLTAVDAAVSAGKVRYVGVSNYCGWQLMQAGLLARHSFPGARIVSAQQEYSLLERGIEREVLGAAKQLGIGVLAWSPLARGVLTGKYRNSTPSKSRGADPDSAAWIAPYLEPACTGVVDAVCTAAEGLSVQPAQLALAWVRDRPGVSSVILGPRDRNQLRTLLAADELELPPAIDRALDDVSTPPMGYPERGMFQ